MKTIKSKFIIAGILALVSMISMLALGQYTTQKVKVFDEVSIAISHTQAGMLTLRRNEKDFLARNDLKYRDKFTSNFSVLETNVNSLQEAISQAGLETTQVEAMKGAFADYQNSFFKLVSIQQKIGMHSKDGLYGALRDAVHQAETEIKTLQDQHLRADMLQLRRNEKDFMLRLNLKYLDKFNKNIGIFLQTLNHSDHPSANKDKLHGLMKQYQQRFKNLVKNNQHKGLTSKGGLLGEMRTTVHESEIQLAQITEQMNIKIQEEVGSMDTLLLVTNAIGFVLAILILAVLFWLANAILRPMQELGRIMTQAASENDLSLRMTIKTQDEIGKTGLAFNSMLEKFQMIVGQVSTSSSQIAAASEEMSAITTQTSQGIQNQQSQTEQLATAMNQMAATVQEVARNSIEAADAASQANNESNNGHQVVNTAVGTINTLAESIQKAATSIQRVENDSQQIGTVLDVIRGIAEQTNLLALNAAIEAARAGEQGRGFAVVADEVRTLAGRTQESTAEIQQMIESLQTGTAKSVQLMDESRELTQTSVEQTSKAGDAINGIVQAVDTINNMNTQIASAAEEQGSVAEEINQNVVSISEIADQTTQGASQTAQTSEDLARLAVDLQTLVAQFKA